ncbi:MAG: RdgB/HAM1 family non-canonical purine NTP pyrophosphatase [Pyrinomonadaceae bacterium]|nr:RdgB/HAM1 family non-canonical purine NTP pyrophosphatase [Pyrinomonadaceae bacterium]
MSETLPKELVIATRNPGKLIEVREILLSLPVTLRSLLDFPESTEVEETGATFADNASIKARAYALQTGAWTLSDDSGLEVDALGGAPGVYSARYAGESATDEERVELLLSKLARTGDSLRRARFICAVSLADPAGRILNVSEGTCEGRIAHSPRGRQGFGYDPVFIPEGFEQTFGELSSEVKQIISHRARALSGTSAFLLKLFGSRG